MSRPTGDEAGIRNESSVIGSSVQAGTIHGDVHLHTGTKDKSLVPRQLPSSVRHFVNREVERDALNTLLNGASSEGVVLISAIDGTAGVGKSTLAVHWAYQVRDRFPDGELYVNLRGFDPAVEPMTPDEALASFLAALEVPAERIPEDRDAKAALFRSALHDKKVLILLDNARSADQVRPLLPGGRTCVVLITSRYRLDDLAIREGATRLSLDVLDNVEARALLARYLGADRLEAEPYAATALLEHCAGLPLALGIVAVQAAELPDFPLDDLVAELRDERDRLDTLDTGGETGIRAVFSWSYHSLSSVAARVFRLLSLPTGPDISLAAAAALAGITDREARRALAELTRANLVEQHAPGRFRFHDLLRAYAAECVSQDESEEDRSAALRRLFDHYLQTSNAIYERVVAHGRPYLITPPQPTVAGLNFSDDADGLRWWSTEQDNLLAAIVQGPDLRLHVHTWQLLQTLTYFFKTGRYPDNWRTIYDIAINAAEACGDLHAKAWMLEELGTVHYNRRDYVESERIAELEVVLFRQVGDRCYEATALVGIAVCRARRQEYESALRPLLEARELMVELGFPSRAEPAYLYSVLGQVYVGLGRFDEAFPNFQSALDLCRQEGEQYGIGWILTHLARAYQASGRLDDALDTFRKAVAHRREIGHRQGEPKAFAAWGMRSTSRAMSKARGKRGSKPW